MANDVRSERLSKACSFLFTPGDQPDRVIKALQLKVDAVIIDLEDSVPTQNKDLAREATARVINQHRVADSPLVLIRVNAFSSSQFELDVRAALSLGVDAIMLPKFIPGSEAARVDRAITAMEMELGIEDELSVIPLIESTLGVLNLISVSSFPKRVIRLAFGGADLHADLGVTYSESGANSAFAMASIVMASVNNGLASPIDSPHFEVEDDQGLERSSFLARDMGFGAKLCIHPKQLEIVANSFQRDLNQENWAVKVLESWEKRSTSKGAILVDGSLVDEAMVKRARQILSGM